jgi:methionine-rich copper-binding protein CopC
MKSIRRVLHSTRRRRRRRDRVSLSLYSTLITLVSATVLLSVLSPAPGPAPGPGPGPGPAGPTGQQLHLQLLTLNIYQVSGQPVLQSLTPSHLTQNLDSALDPFLLQAEFNSAVQWNGTSSVSLVPSLAGSDATVSISITANPTRFSVEDLTKATLNVASLVSVGETYNVVIPSGTIIDTSTSIAYSGVSLGSWTVAMAGTFAFERVSLSPGNGDSDIATATVPTITYNHVLSAGNSGAISITSLKTGTVTSIPYNDPQLVLDGKNLQIHVTLEAGAVYNIIVNSGVVQNANAVSNPGISQSSEWQFTTLGVAAPSITPTSPAHSSTGNDPDSDLVMTFSEHVQLGTGTITVVSDSRGATIFSVDVTTPSVVSINGAVVTVSLSTLPSGEQFHVLVPTTAFKSFANVDCAGITLTTSWVFSTSGGLAPIVQTYIPDDNFGTVDPSSTTTLTVDFDETIALGSGTVTLTDDTAGSSSTYTVAGGTLSASGKRLTISGISLAEAKSYHVSTSGVVVQNLIGQAWAGISDSTTWNFVTSGAFNLRLTSLSPAANAQNVSVSTNLVLTFDQYILEGSGNIYLHDQKTGVVTTIDVQSSQVSTLFYDVTVNATNDLTSGAAYYVTMDPGAIVVYVAPSNIFSGLQSPAEWPFITAGVAAPSITPTSPAHSSTGNDPDSDLVMTFSEHVQLGTGTITVVSDSRGVTQFSVDVITPSVVSINGAVVTVSLSTLPSGEQFHVLVPTTAFKSFANVDCTGVALTTSWVFATSGGSGPIAQTYTPDDDLTTVDPSSTTTLTVDFDQIIVLGSGTVTLTDDTGTTSTHTAAGGSLSVSGQRLTISGISLAEAKYYHVSTSGVVVQSLIGQVWAGISDSTTWNFVTTGTFNLRLTSLSPVATAQNVSVSTNLVLTFNHWVLAGSGNIYLHDQKTGVVTTIDVQSSQVSTSFFQLTINPTNDLTSGAAYYVTMDPGAIVVSVAPSNIFSGLQSPSEWPFVTLGVAAPSITPTSPAHSSTGNDPDSDLVMTFSEHVQLGTGTITVVSNSRGATQFNVDVTTPSVVSINGAVVTVSLSTLPSGEQFHVLVPTTAFKSFANVSCTGIVLTTSWVFSTSGGSGPIVQTYTPDDDFGTVDPSSTTSLTVDFDEVIVLGSGTVTLTDDNTGATSTYTGAGGSLSVSGQRLTISGVSLAEAKYYHVSTSGVVVQNLIGQAWTGISDSTTWNFVTTGAFNLRLTSLSPVATAQNVSVSTNLVLTFDQYIREGSGNIYLHDQKTGVVTTIDVQSSQVSTFFFTVTINPTNDLTSGAAYYVTMDPGAIVVFVAPANIFSGLQSPSEWPFVTAFPTFPTVTNFNPASGSSELGTSQRTFTLTMSEYVQEGSCTIVFEDTAGASSVSVFVPSSAFSITNNLVSITATLTASSYIVIVPPSCIRSFAGVDFVGLANTGSETDYTICTDKCALTVTSRVPAHEATNVLTSQTTIEIAFTPDISIRDPGNMYLVDVSSNTTYSWDGNDNALSDIDGDSTLELQLSGNELFNPGCRYYVLIDNALVRSRHKIDGSHQYWEGYSSSSLYYFQTSGGEAPFITALPTNQSLTVPTGYLRLTATFDETVFAGTSGSITIYNDSSPSSVYSVLTIPYSDTIRLAHISKVLTISDASATMPAGWAFRVAIGSQAVQNSVGQYFAGIGTAYEWWFVTSGAQDPFAPTYSYPSHNQVEVPLVTNITLYFAERPYSASGQIIITDDSVGDSSRTVFVPYTSEILQGDPGFATDKTLVSYSTVTLVLGSALSAGRKYTVALPASLIRSAARRYVAASTFSFFTTGIQDPYPEAFMPVHQSTVSASTGSISIDFIENIQASSSTSAFITISDLSTGLQATTIAQFNPVLHASRFSYTALGQRTTGRVTIDIQNLLSDGVYYRVEVDSGALQSTTTGRTNVQVNSTAWQFGTSGGAPLTATLFPADNAQFIPAGISQLFLTFSASDAAVVYRGTGTIVVENDSDQTTLLSADVATSRNISIDATRRIVTIDVGALEGGKHYHIIVPDNAFTTFGGVRTFAGTTQASWQFMTYLNGTCGPCPIGTVGNGDVCTRCSTGSYNFGSSSCLGCPPGRFSELTGSSTCVACSPGRFNYQWNQTVCSECEAGKYQGQYEQKECTVCPQGRFAVNNGTSVCKVCDAGSFSVGGVVSSCSACSAGSFNNYTGMSYCFECSAHTYQDAVGQVSCVDCPVGRATAFTNQTQCASCTVGKIANVTGMSSCTNCTQGMYAPRTQMSYCLECSAGKYSELQGQSLCQECPKGSFSRSTLDASGIASCEPCPIGRFKNETGSQECDLCARGSIANVTGQTVCHLCAIGSYQDELGQTECKECKTGGNTGFGETTCVSCAAGRFSEIVQKQRVCSACPEGKFASEQDSIQCDDCPLGRANSGTGAQFCSPCSVGSFANSTGFSICLQCAAGTFQSGTEGVNCTACDGGKFAERSGLSVCSACTPGRFQNITGQASCEACPIGRFTALTEQLQCQSCLLGKATSQAGLSSCIDCAAGSYAPVVGLANCLSCPVGKFMDGVGMSFCNNCSAGTASSFTGVSACQPCSTGTYAPGDGLVECIECSAGKFQVATGATNCTNCTEGSAVAIAGQSACIPCAVGSYAPTPGLEVCVSCPAGRSQPSIGSVNCTDCAGGKFAENAAKATCDVCPVGRYSLPGQSECTGCETGEYQPDSEQQQCLKCPAGSVSTASASSGCTPCDSGRYANASGLSICEPCAAGKISVKNGTVGPTECSDCPIGQFAGDVGSFVCSACTVGRFGTGLGAGTCQACPPGTYQDEAGTSFCKDCAIGRAISLSGQAACGLCESGKFSNTTGLEECILCAIGTYSDTGAVQCTGCDVGRYSPSPGTVSCPQCAVGRYMPNTNATACLACDPGKAQRLEGSTQCNPCGNGTAASATGQQECPGCLPGTYANVTGLSQCENCPVGRISVFGSTSCSLCEPGTYVDNTGAAVCKACPAGTYMDEYGASVCKDCAPGSSQPLSNRTSCVPCSAGRFATDAGRVECVACDIGKYANDSGIVNCLSCGAGTFGNSTALTTCAVCPPGRFQPVAGTSVCIEAGAGSYAAPGNLSVLPLASTPCEVGKYSAASGLSSCIQCLKPEYQTSQGATRCTTCESGSYAVFASGSDTQWQSCEECPTGTYCSGDGTVVVQTGYWTSWNDETGEVKAFQCLEGLCTGTESGTTQGTCGPNRKNFSENTMCAECLEFYYEWNGECVPCDGIRWDIIAILAFFAFVFVVFMHWASQSSSGAIKVFLYYIQMSVLFAGEDLDWAFWSQAFNFDMLKTSGSTCVMPLNQDRRMFLSFVVPVVSFFMLALLVCIHGTWYFKCNGREKVKRKFEKEKKKREKAAAAAAAAASTGSGSVELELDGSTDALNQHHTLGSSSMDDMKRGSTESVELARLATSGTQQAYANPTELLRIISAQGGDNDNKSAPHSRSDSRGSEAELDEPTLASEGPYSSQTKPGERPGAGSDDDDVSILSEAGTNSDDADKQSDKGSDAAAGPGPGGSKRTGLQLYWYNFKVYTGLNRIGDIFWSEARALVVYDGRKYARTAIGLFLFSFNVIVNALLEFFNCIDVDIAIVVQAYPAVDCRSNTYTMWYPLAIPMLVLTVLLIPIGFALFLRRAHNTIVLPQKGGIGIGNAKSNDSDDTQSDAENGHDGSKDEYDWFCCVEKKAKLDGPRRITLHEFRATWGILSDTYKDDRFWWEVVILYRRTALVAIVVFFAEERLRQLVIVSLFNVFFFAVHGYMMPFYNSLENAMEACSLLMLTILTLVLPLYPAPPYDTEAQVVISILVFVPFVFLLLFGIKAVTTAEEKAVIEIEFNDVSKWAESRNADVMQELEVIGKLPDGAIPEIDFDAGSDLEYEDREQEKMGEMPVIADTVVEPRPLQRLASQEDDDELHAIPVRNSAVFVPGEDSKSQMDIVISPAAVTAARTGVATPSPSDRNLAAASAGASTGSQLSIASGQSEPRRRSKAPAKARRAQRRARRRPGSRRRRGENIRDKRRQNVQHADDESEQRDAAAAAAATALMQGRLPANARLVRRNGKKFLQLPSSFAPPVTPRTIWGDKPMLRPRSHDNHDDLH